jgi:hypothetical protein
VVAYVDAPCNTLGNYDITFKLNGGSQYAQAETISNLEIVPCYDYTIYSDKNLYTMCENEKLIVPVKVQNTGTSPNTYSIKISAPTWIQSDQKTISLAAGEEKNFNLIIQPSFSTKGNFSAELELQSDKGKITKKLDFNLNVNSCYGLSVNIERDSDQICNGLSSSYNASIKNLGNFPANFDIKLEAPAWAKVDKSIVSLNASQEANLLITINPLADTKSADYAIILNVTDPVSKNEAQDSLTIKTLTEQDCYKPLISSNGESVDVYQDGTATFAFSIDNKGIKDAEYVVEISGNAAQFARVTPTTLQIAAGKAQTLYLYLAPSVDLPAGVYSVNIAARLKDTSISSSKTIFVNVVATKAESEALPETNATKQGFFQMLTGFFIKLFGLDKKETPTPQCSINNLSCQLEVLPLSNETNESNQSIQEVSENATINITGANVTNASTNVPEENETVSENTSTTSPITGSAINETNEIIAGNNLPPKLVKDIPNLEISSGDSVTVDLSEYFQDPENDALEYIAVKPLNLGILIEENKITIKAPSDFEGVRDVIFYATDGKNMVQSNQVNITVTKKTGSSGSSTPSAKPVSFAQFFAQYKNYVTGAIIILVIIILIVSGLGKKLLDFLEEDEGKNEGKKK